MSSMSGYSPSWTSQNQSPLVPRRRLVPAPAPAVVAAASTLPSRWLSIISLGQGPTCSTRSKHLLQATVALAVAANNTGIMATTKHHLPSHHNHVSTPQTMTSECCDERRTLTESKNAVFWTLQYIIPSNWMTRKEQHDKKPISLPRIWKQQVELTRH